MEIQHVEIFKNGERVAEADPPVKYFPLDFLDFPRLQILSLPRVTLDRIIIFKHLQGAPLSDFFNGCGVRLIHPGNHFSAREPFFYVHGRSETIRGTTRVTAVVLATFEDGSLPDVRKFAGKLPELYREVSRTL